MARPRALSVRRAHRDRRQPCENPIRPTSIGKRNWLFIGEARVGHRAGILCTVVEICRQRDIDSFAYLSDVLTRLPAMHTGQLPEVTPKAWAKARKHRPSSRAAA